MCDLIDSGYWDDQIRELREALRALLDEYDAFLDDTLGTGVPDPDFSKKYPANVAAEKLLKEYD